MLHAASEKLKGDDPLTKRLYRSDENRVIGGVCGGIAEYFDLDPTLVRLLWVILTFSAGIGLLAYIVSMIIIPGRPQTVAKYSTDDIDSGVNGPAGREDSTGIPSGEENRQSRRTNDRNRVFAGIVLIALGIFFLARRWFYWIDLHRLWPVLLILAGVYVIFRGKGDK
jgi:phage shock protein C